MQENTGRVSDLQTGVDEALARKKPVCKQPPLFLSTKWVRHEGRCVCVLGGWNRPPTTLEPHNSCSTIQIVEDVKWGQCPRSDLKKKTQTARSMQDSTRSTGPVCLVTFSFVVKQKKKTKHKPPKNRFFITSFDFEWKLLKLRSGWVNMWQNCNETQPTFRPIRQNCVNLKKKQQQHPTTSACEKENLRKCPQILNLSSQKQCSSSSACSHASGSITALTSGGQKWLQPFELKKGQLVTTATLSSVKELQGRSWEK